MMILAFHLNVICFKLCIYFFLFLKTLHSAPSAQSILDFSFQLRILLSEMPNTVTLTFLLVK